MHDPPENIDDSGRTTVALGHLLNSDAPLPPAWRSDDLGDLFRHQLQARLKDEAIAPDVFQSTPEALACDVPIQALLLDSQTPVAVYQTLKTYARWLGQQDAARYPSDCAAALYYCAIGAAWLHTGERITMLPDAGMRQGLEWAAGQEWVPEEIRTMLIQANSRECT